MELTPEYKIKIRGFIEKWDAEHPVDYWWRKKFKIPFGSPEHLVTSFVDQHIWYAEEEFIQQLSERADEESGVINTSKDEIILTQSQIEDAFEEMDE